MYLLLVFNWGKFRTVMCASDHLINSVDAAKICFCPFQFLPFSVVIFGNESLFGFIYASSLMVCRLKIATKAAPDAAVVVQSYRWGRGQRGREASFLPESQQTQ